MSLAFAIKSLLGNVALATGYFSRTMAHHANCGQSLILMYHRIIDPKLLKGSVEPGMYVTPKTFEMHLQFLLKYFTIVNLEQLANSENSVCGKKPLCALTFDDGWLDFYTFAYPLLVKYSVPATVYLPTSFIGTNKMFWTDVLAEVVKECGSELNGLGKGYSSVVKQVLEMQGDYETRLDNAIKLFKTLKPKQIAAEIKELVIATGKKEVTQNRAFLNWNEVAELKALGLVTFGSHTVNHHLLTSLEPVEVEQELLESKKTLIDQNAVEPLFLSFCYPNGNVTPTIAKQTCQAGYHLAVTTKAGWRHTKDNNFTLNRIAVHDDVTKNKGLLAFRLLH